jgi:aminomethyltransferase
MVDFAGWAMPVQYTSIMDEHNATRNAVGITDISHMGRLRFEGPGATVFLAKTLTRKVADLALGQIRYSLITNRDGGIMDDVLVGRYHNVYGQPFFLMVVNASNRQKIVDWINELLTPERANRPGEEVLFTDLTSLWAMFAIQGPNAVKVLQPLVETDLSQMKYYRGAPVQLLHPDAARQGGIISRTGYTGEDGFELSMGAQIAPAMWQAILNLGEPYGIKPTGIGCRDTLRLEAGMPLYGHELSETINPFQADLGFACHLTGYDFPGRDILLKIKDQPRETIRVAIELEGRRAARENSEIFVGDQKIGVVTSGSFSPTLEKPIAMGYVPPEHAEPGTELSIDIRGTRCPARVTTIPFYSRKKKK